MDAGRCLRYRLTLMLLSAQRPMSVEELIEGLERAGLAPCGRPSKVVSDALRWEIRRGRVRRLRRGVYIRGDVPRSTRWWLLDQVRIWEAASNQTGRV